MRSKFKWIFTLLVAFTMQFSFAQQKTVTGTVTSEGKALPGATVRIEGTYLGTQTDENGKFSIKTKQGDVLEISFLGKDTKNVTVGDGSVVNVVLATTDNTIQVVQVVLAYDRKQTKAKSVAASTTVTAETFRGRPNVSFLQSLQGASPGLSVTTNSGSPGSAKIDIIVRGIGTLNGSTEPLYVVDGVPSNAVVFRALNPEDIESATILRDAISTSIYGNRGANGVILVNTKRGKANSFNVDYSNTIGFSTFPDNDYNVANSQQALEISRRKGQGAGVGLTDAQIASYGTTDWVKHFFKTTTATTHNLSVTAGGKNLNSFTSLGYTEQEGLVPTTDFKRFTFRNNLNGKSNNEKFTYNSSFTAGLTKRNQLDQETNTGLNSNTVQNPLLGSLTGHPYIGVNDYPGSGQALYDMIGSNFNDGNTIFVLQDILTKGNVPNQLTDVKILGNIGGTYKLTKDLSVSSKMGVDYNVVNRTFARAPWSYLGVVVRETSGLPFGGFERRTNEVDFGFNSVTNLNYKKTFNEKHTLGLGAYVEYVKAHRTQSFLGQNGLDLKTYSFGAGTGWSNVGAGNPALRPTVSGNKSDAGLFSYFGTLDYDYDDKYGFEATVRRDATYRFINENKWGTFFALGGRWNIDKEAFMDNSAFDMLKLRGSYGTQGNQNILAVASGVNPLYAAPNIYESIVATGTGYGNSGAYVFANFPNTTVRWEKQTMANIGLDFDVFKRLSGTIDVYKKTTEDLFTSINLSAPVGNGTNMPGNNGAIENKGIELMLRYKVLKNKAFKLDVFANGSYNKNEVTNIVRAVNDNRINENGSLVNEYYLQPYAGINPANGDLQYIGADGSLTDAYNENARVRTGKSDTPVYTGAFGFNAEYKGFFFDAQFTFVKDVWLNDGALIWLYNPDYIGDTNVSADLLNAWTPTNTNTNIPALNATNLSTLFDNVDTFYKDASYIRAKNVSFGYSFNNKQLKDSPIKNLKFFVQGENLYTWTDWRGFDPDVNTNSLSQYPSPRTISFGVNVGF